MGVFEEEVVGGTEVVEVEEAGVERFLGGEIREAVGGG